MLVNMVGLVSTYGIQGALEETRSTGSTPRGVETL